MECQFCPFFLNIFLVTVMLVSVSVLVGNIISSRDIAAVSSQFSFILSPFHI